jgi:hypothetical protein
MATIFSFDILQPRRAFPISDPQRTDSKPSAVQMLVQQKSPKTNVKLAADALSRHIAEGF